MHYLRFEEYLVFLEKPSDQLDAATVATNVSPYSKWQSENPLKKDKEMLEFPNQPLGDPLLSVLDPKIIKNRSSACVKPRELLAKAIEGKTLDQVSLKGYPAVLDFMQKLELAFIQEQEKLDFLLDLAILNWNGMDNFKNSLTRASFIINANSLVFYKTLPEIIAKKDKQSFANALTSFFSAVTIPRDVNSLKNIILLAHNYLPPEDTKMFTALSTDVVNGTKLSLYPKGLMYKHYIHKPNNREDKYLNKEEYDNVPKEILNNSFYTKVYNHTDTELSLANMGLTDDDAIAVAEGLKRNGALYDIDLRIFPYNF
jgi:hypothetical protein